MEEMNPSQLDDLCVLVEAVSTATVAIERPTGGQKTTHISYSLPSLVWPFVVQAAIAENTIHAVMPSNMVAWLGGCTSTCAMYIYVHDRHAGHQSKSKIYQEDPCRLRQQRVFRHAEHKSFSCTLEPCLTQNRTRTFATLLYNTTRTRQTGRAKSFIDTWTGITTKTRRKQNSTA
jgi:hypothetical protein